MNQIQNHKNLPLFKKIEIFDWTSEDQSQRLRFYVSEMREAIAQGRLKYETLEAYLDPEWLKTWLLQRDLDIQYCFTLAKLPERLKKPLLGVRMEDQTILLIDGSHTYMARYLANCQSCLWHIVDLPLWKAFSEEL